ncbi:hypothetical protein [Roseibacillus persicicus]|uniref:hypothetical protein n=1 Tax=Roseibacillus persicicus TaxID=454148 RepID=UPI00280EA9E9|nr:hypothetical protein [Roseibacillus persicicus]MDQ8190117.1 hypothetical protein [Roseibacillus persicicus]
MKKFISTLAVGLLLTATSWGEEAAVTSNIEAKVKAATVIDGKGGIYEWLAKGAVKGSSEWKSMGQVLMMPKTMFMVELNLIYSKEGGTPSAVLSPKLGSDLKFTEVEAGEGKTIQTFEVNENPAAVRVFDDNKYLYLTVTRIGKMEKDAARKELLAIIQAIDLERVK